MNYSLFIVFVLCIEIKDSSASSRSSFGEECSKTRKCDRKAWLSCHQGSCNCSRPEEMYYDNKKGKCVTKSGERCKFGVEESGEIGLVEITDCVANSQCGEDGICVCDSRYHEIFNGTCDISKSFGESCSDEDKCSQLEKLHCINGSCSCKEELSVYSSVVSQCVGVPSQNCISGKCSEGAECNGGKCVCDNIDHYEDSSSKTCLLRKGIREKCNSDSECIRKDLLLLKCVNGTCHCEVGFKFSKVQKNQYSLNLYKYRYSYGGYFYENILISSLSSDHVEICAPIVGEKCPDGYCVPTSKCLIPSDRRNYIQTHFVESRYKSVYIENWNEPMQDTIVNLNSSSIVYNETVCECLPEYPYTYRDKSRCGKHSTNDCESNDNCLNNLVCYKGTCKCPSSTNQKLSHDSKYCISKIASRCKTDTYCPAYSFCKLLRNSTVGYCQCKDGYIENNYRECEGSFGSPCEYSEEKCDKTAKLVCIDKKCSCEDDLMHTYSPTARKCLGVVGAHCGISLLPLCTENAECSLSNFGLPDRCSCSKGYVENENSTCQQIML